LIDLHQVTKRAGVSDYKTHQKPRRRKPLAVQFFQGVVLEYLVFLEEFIDLIPGFEPEKPPQICPGETIALLLLSGQSFQCAPRQIANSPHPGGEVVRNLHGHVHDLH